MGPDHHFNNSHVLLWKELKKNSGSETGYRNVDQQSSIPNIFEFNNIRALVCVDFLPRVKNMTSRFGINALSAIPKAHSRDPAKYHLDEVPRKHNVKLHCK